MLDDQDLKINTLEINYKVMLDKVDNLSSLVKEEFKSLRTDMAKDRENLMKNYVSKTEFRVVRSIVFGLVTIILTAVVGSLLSSVLANNALI